MPLTSAKVLVGCELPAIVDGHFGVCLGTPPLNASRVECRNGRSHPTHTLHQTLHVRRGSLWLSSTQRFEKIDRHCCIAWHNKLPPLDRRCHPLIPTRLALIPPYVPKQVQSLVSLLLHNVRQDQGVCRDPTVLLQGGDSVHEQVYEAVSKG